MSVVESVLGSLQESCGDKYSRLQRNHVYSQKERELMNRLLVLTAIFVAGFVNVGTASARHPLMHYTQAQLDQMEAARVEAVQRDMASSPKISAQSALPASVDLTQYLLTSVADRDQGGCGDCWQWSNTGAVEILSSLSGDSAPLSVQYINSGMGVQNEACAGGSTQT